MHAIAEHQTGESQDYVAHRAFEALFAHGLPEDAGLTSRLRTLGYDAAHPKDTYSAQLWQDAVEAARQHHFSALPADEGLRLLGHAFIHGFSHTLVGEILCRGAAVLGPERVLARVASYLRVVRSDVQTVITPLDLHHWRLTFTGRMLPALVAGTVEAMVGLCNVKAEAAVIEETPARFSIEVRW